MKFDKKEFLRDVESLGSFAFYFVVVIRSLVDFYWPFFFQLFLGIVLSQFLLQLSGYFLKQKISSHISNAVLLIVFVNLFYKSRLFFAFSFLLFILLCFAHKKIRRHSWREMMCGLIIGAVSSGIVWWVV